MPGSEEGAAGARVGRYELRAPLGRGGAATVWRVWDPELEVERALKLLDARPGAADEDRSARLRREARAMAALGHAHVLRVLDIGEHDGRPFVVSELAPGGSLADRVEADGPLPLAEAGRLLAQVLSAVSAAHDAGIIHRDIKPQNVLLNADGDALLADFGIARLTDDTADRSTRTGMALGSLAYMAPEQRLDAHRVGPAADVYAIGATAYHLLTGLSPMDLFVAGPDDPRWAGVPVGLRSVLVQATRYDPAQRYAGADALADALATAIALGGAVVPAAEREESAPPAPVVAPTVATPAAVAAPVAAQRRRPAALVWVGVGVMLAVLLGVWFAWPDDAPAPAAERSATSPPRPAPVAVAPEPLPPEPERAVAPPEPEPEPAAAAPAPAPKPAAPAPVTAAPVAALAALVGSWEGQSGELVARWTLSPGPSPETLRIAASVYLDDKLSKPTNALVSLADGAGTFSLAGRDYTLRVAGKTLSADWRKGDTSHGQSRFFKVDP